MSRTSYSDAMSVTVRGQDEGGGDSLVLKRFGEFLTCKQVASVLPHTSVSSVQRGARSGRLAATKSLGGEWLIPWWVVEEELQKLSRLSRPQRSTESPTSAEPEFERTEHSE